MADDGSRQSTTVWPLPKFFFQVSWDDVVVSFQEVSGLDVEAQTVEYRHGDSPVFAPIKMPGLKKFGNVTMKKGLFKNDTTFWTWLDQTRMNTVARKNVTVSLLDEAGKPSMVWTLKNAWPTKITSTAQKADGNEVPVESIEFAHEGLSVANG